MFKNAKKDDLRLVAVNLNETVTDKMSVLELTNIIKSSEKFKSDSDFVEELIKEIVETRKSEEQRELQFEKIKLEKTQAELELAKIRAEARDISPEKENPVEKNESLDSIVKSVRTLTLRVPSKPEGWVLYFASLERAFHAKNVPEKFKAEVLINLLGEKASNVLTYIKDDELCDYLKVKTIVLREFEPSPQSVLEQFRKAVRQPNETHLQFTSRLTTSFDYYLKLKKVTDFDSLKKLMVSDKLFQTLDKETASFISIRQAESWFEPIQLGKEIDVYSASRGKISTSISTYQKNSYPKNVSKSFLAEVKGSKCILHCDEKNSHFVSKCPNYKALSVDERVDVVKRSNLCFNCLGFHKKSACESKSSCYFCSKKHHSTLCYSQGKNVLEHRTPSNESVRASAETNNQTGMSQTFLSPTAAYFEPRHSLASATENLAPLGCSNQNNSSKTFAATSYVPSSVNTVLLSTINCLMRDGNGNFQQVRGLLDVGSQSNFMSADCVNRLKLKRDKINVRVSGISDLTMPINSQVKTTISNEDRKFEMDLSFLVVPRITDFTPSKPLKINEQEFNNVKLADKYWYLPNPVEFLISGEFFYELLRPGQVYPSGSKLILQNSVFGYIVSGSVPSENEFKTHCGLIKEENDLNQIMERFWHIEQVPETESLKSAAEIECNDHFLKTFKRDESGKFIVQMPLKKDPSTLGDSKQNAVTRLNSLWNRLERDPELLELYCQFLNEYKELGHMEEVVEASEPDVAYYLPHHAVYRPDKPSTKLRVVFNGSHVTSSGESLNSLQLNGGVIQDDLFTIILRFRTHLYAFIADVKMMYRMIIIDECQRDLQRIVWKDNKNDCVKTYRLCTVTYGTTSAPYLAMRCLQQLGIEGEKQFPKAAAVVQSSFYMDDVLTGADDLPSAKTLQNELVELLGTCGMQLHKWCSNHPDLMETVSNRENYNFDKTNPTKALGLLWKPQTDVFSFNLSCKVQTTVTKRGVLSTIARIFDPLGLLGPMVTRAKIFLQRLWRLHIDWDDPLPKREAEEWLQFQESLKATNNICVERFVLIKNPVRIAIFGFADASENAYGAAIYLASVDSSREFSSQLLCSKSRVAPLKTVTIPRLELCAAVLLAKLMSKVIPTLKVVINSCIYFSDSTIVLAWLQKSPSDLKTFVATRVATIQRLSDVHSWRHVSSHDNPADLVSRGLDPEQLLHNNMWWHGPLFMTQETETYSPDFESEADCLKNSDFAKELKTVSSTTLMTIASEQFLNSILNLSNKYLKIIRVISFIFRFVCNVRSQPSVRLQGPLKSEEIRRSELFLCKLVQRGEYNSELTCIKRGLAVSPKSKLRSLNPFIDSEGILRVGGRLSQSELPYDSKYPVILPGNHKLTKLIMTYFHVKNLHVGPQTLINCVRNKFWVVHGRNLARSVVRECVTCFKAKPTSVEQIMGVLPTERVTPGSPFNICGIDFCGPFAIQYKGQRKGTLQKVYVAIFVCFATRAIHLEVVSDLTSAALIATLKRFFARRGKSAKLFTDNATNFVGASLELKRLNKLLCAPDDLIAGFFSSEGIEWRFLPPRAPNFGGLWEAGVKSFKHHLRRVVGNSKLTFEEFHTVVTQIEGILNSRPLVPMSSEANDFNALTPGHFLIGRPINALVEPDISDQPDNKLTRWKRTTGMVQQIWKRWHQDYLSHLQQRSKWQIQKHNVKLGALVLLKEDNLPPCKWVLGRIDKVIRGPDKNIRVVDVMTPSGLFRRSISKICILPVETN